MLGLILVINKAAQYVIDGVRGSDGSFEMAAILSTAGAVSALQAGSRMYLLRWPARINFSTRNFRVRHRLVSCPWSL